MLTGNEYSKYTKYSIWGSSGMRLRIRLQSSLIPVQKSHCWGIKQSEMLLKLLAEGIQPFLFCILAISQSEYQREYVNSRFVIQSDLTTCVSCQNRLKAWIPPSLMEYLFNKAPDPTPSICNLEIFLARPFFFSFFPYQMYSPILKCLKCNSVKVLSH